VLIGGFPRYITAEKVIEELVEKGYNVLNEPKIFPGFSPSLAGVNGRSSEVTEKKEVFTYRNKR